MTSYLAFLRKVVLDFAVDGRPHFVENQGCIAQFYVIIAVYKVECSG
jgi:hypothetical protein